MNDRVILYTRVKPINKKYLEKMGLNTNNSTSACLDAVLDSVRLNREITLKTRTPKVIEKAKKLQARKRRRIRELSGLSRRMI